MTSRAALTLAALVAVPMLGICSSKAGTFTHISFIKPDSSGSGAVTGVLATDSSGDLLAETSFSVYLFKAASGYGVQLLLYSEPISPDPFGIYLSGGLTVQADQILGDNSGLYDVPGSAKIVDFGKATAIAPSVVHSFTKAYSGANYPLGLESGLSRGLHGRAYGTSSNSNGNHALGSAFFVYQGAQGSKYHQIFQFDGSDGIQGYPNGGRLAQNPDGSLVGLTRSTTSAGTPSGQLYRLRNSDASWTGNVLYTFSGAGAGMYPVTTNAVLDPAGSIFTCLAGGIYAQGGIMEFSPPTRPNEPWQARVLAQFGPQTYDPIVSAKCGITLDSQTGQIIGLSDQGGQYGYGALFSLTPPSVSGTRWQLGILHHFSGTPHDGAASGFAPLQIGSTFYGTSGNIVWSWSADAAP